MNERKLTPVERVYSVSTPIFTPEIGQRLSIARMKLLMDQAELARTLGCGQASISRLEKGAQATLEKPFSVLQFKDLFGPLWTYILFGTNEGNINAKHIVSTYWKFRLSARKRSKQGDQLSKVSG